MSRTADDVGLDGEIVTDAAMRAAMPQRHCPVCVPTTPTATSPHHCPNPACDVVWQDWEEDE